MTPTVTDGAAMIATPAETPQASAKFSAWLNNAMHQHGAQTAAHGAVSTEIDTDLEGDAGVAAEDELLAIIEQFNGMLSGSQVSATHIGSVASAPTATEDDAVRCMGENDHLRQMSKIVCFKFQADMV